MTRTLVATPDPERPRNERPWASTTTTGTATTSGWIVLNRKS